MLQPYSARGQILTLLAQYKNLGEQRRDTLKRIRQTRTMYMIAYDHVGKETWDGGSWKTDKGLRLLAQNLKRLTDQEVTLRERLTELERDALGCFMLIAKIIPELLERCQGTMAEILQGRREGFSFEI
ncbi:uncharacterized protein H6S33_007972 [Morchella sextelata]|uniref:uncharacterized protein n=1 Tax=Morchella sextelata TaxID=1174677 RepID=UPI001D05965C|nr:uncharacterized protein H6S33_007972 [Morchella sextelata]KAH0602968.1 hypothetical protein H6S33_007972 [Morchella sextelata]